MGIWTDKGNRIIYQDEEKKEEWGQMSNEAQEKYRIGKKKGKLSLRQIRKIEDPQG